jgi:hypothetical protein
MPFAQTPKTTFGIELEMGLYSTDNLHVNTLWDELRYFLEHTDTLQNKWELKDDGSVRGDIGGEITTKGGFELSDLLAETKIVCAKLKKYEKSGNIKIDGSAGFHIHMGVQDWTVKHLRAFYKAFYNSIEEWFAFQPPSRSRSEFCRHNSYDDIFQELRRDNRYLALNPLAIVKYGTLEMRLFAGTIQYYKIEKTLQVVNAYIKGVLKPLPEGQSPKDGLFDVIDNKKILHFVLNRIKKVQKGNSSLISKFNQKFLEKSATKK